jgi:hypothetical protein
LQISSRGFKPSLKCPMFIPILDKRAVSFDGIRSPKSADQLKALAVSVSYSTGASLLENGYEVHSNGA